MKPRLLKSTLSMVLGAALVSGCAQGSGGDGAESDASFDPEAKLSGNLTVMGFGATDEIATTRWTRRKKALGDVKVKLIEGDLDIQQFLSSVAAGDPPEIVYADRNQIGTFASRGAIIPLDDCIEGEGIDTDVFHEAGPGPGDLRRPGLRHPRVQRRPDHPGQRRPPPAGRADHRRRQRLRLGRGHRGQQEADEDRGRQARA